MDVGGGVWVLTIHLGNSFVQGGGYIYTHVCSKSIAKLNDGGQQ